jgi:protein O-GlcNAc transferase
MSDLESFQFKIDSIVSLYSQGLVNDALELAQKLIKKYPDKAILFNICGVCYRSLNKLNLALECFNKAIELKPDYIEVNFNLGVTLQEQGNLNTAIKSYKNALLFNPKYVEAFNNMGICFKDLGQTEEAISCFDNALSINSEYVEARNNLGNAFADDGDLQSAIACFKKILLTEPNFYDAYFNLGNALKQIGQFDAAIECFEKVLVIEPNYVSAYNNIGVILLDLGQVNKALDNFEKAIHIDSNYAEALNNLGIAYYKIDQLNQAIKFYEKALIINPDYAEAYANIGDALKDLNQLDESAKHYEKAYAINPDLEFIFGNLLHAKMRLCDWTSNSQNIQKLKNEIKHLYKVIYPFPLSALIDDPHLQNQAAQIFSNQQYSKINSFPKLEAYSSHKKIRLGYFSADFRDHPVAYLTAELYEIHDRSKFEIFAFSYGPDTNDKMNLHIKKSVDHYYDVRLMSFQEVALLCRNLEIDIAIDLGGYTSNSRTEIFEMIVAPIQISYIGFLGTMGADYYDYLLADEIIIPHENQQFFTEKIAYVPCYQMNDSKFEAPSKLFTRKDLNLPESSFIFCCFNNTFKITPATFDSWARILKKVDGSALLIFAENNLARINLKKEISKRGIKKNRLFFADHLSKQDYLARYRVVDLFLDTFPYNAGTTASDALRMGLPIITFTGKSFASRLAASILSAVNLPELIASDQDGYESLAVRLGNDSSELIAIKEKLLKNLPSSPLYDTKSQVKSLELVYTKMQQNLIEKSEKTHIYISKLN